MINVDPIRIREVVSSFVDMHHGEIEDLRLSDDPAGTQDAVMEVIKEIKKASFANMKSNDEYVDWLKERIKSHGEVFAAFVSKGYEFLIFHTAAVYGQEITHTLRELSRIAIENSRVPRTLTEFMQPITISVKWNDLYQQFPYLVFILILRNTFIDCGEAPLPEGQPNAQQQ